MQTWEQAIIKTLNAYKISDFIIEPASSFSVRISLVFHHIKNTPLHHIKLTVSFNYGELHGEYDDSSRMQILLFNVCDEIRAELYRQIQYNNKRYALNLAINDYLRLNVSADMTVSNQITRSQITTAATKWVFETNGNRWSNNNSECGDNFGSFLEGVKFAVEHLGVKIIEDDPE